MIDLRYMHIYIELYNYDYLLCKFYNICYLLNLLF